MTKGGNAAKVVEALRAKVDEVNARLPEGYKVPANTISPKVGEGNIADEEEHYVSEDNRNTDEKK